MYRLILFVGIVLIFLLLVVTNETFAQITYDEASQKQMAMTNLLSMPLAFTENHGQWDEKALFKANAGGATFWFCGDEIAYVFMRDTDELLDDDMHIRPDMPDELKQPRYKKESLVIRAQLIGANPEAEIVGEDRLSHNCNYFYGNDPAKWRTDVPNYSSITYKDIYPGIDLKYHGNGQGMKYDFIVNPGADISQIQIRYEGVDNLAITPNGDLEATTLFGPIHENIPSVYQEIGSSKREVTGRYAKLAPEVFGFEVDDYNPSLTLVIDPELVYSTYLGGNNWEDCYAIAVDDIGSAYVTGETFSNDFPTFNPYQTHQGEWDVFVTKFSPAGNSLIFSTYLGGEDDDYGRCIDIDGNGSVYFAGNTWSTEFPILNAYQADLAYKDVFVTKFGFAARVDDDKSVLPQRFMLLQNYPNPFNAATTIEYGLKRPGHVTIDIYDILGRHIETLVDTDQPAGHHQATWHADDCSSGIYFYKLQAGDYIETKSMLLLK